jgi:hypothetical protein
VTVRESARETPGQARHLAKPANSANLYARGTIAAAPGPMSDRVFQMKIVMRNEPAFRGAPSANTTEPPTRGTMPGPQEQASRSL